MKILGGIEIEGDFISASGTWTDLLVQTTKYLIDRNYLSKEMLPLSVGNVRYLVSEEPVHKNGKDFVEPRKLPKGIWIETNWSSKYTKKNITKLVEVCGVDLENIRLEGDEYSQD